MAWVKLDDAMGEHKKYRRLLKVGGVGAFGLHALAILHSARYLTDGFIEDEFVQETFTETRATKRERERTLAALQEKGVWERVEGGWQIHDYLDHNPSRAEVEDRRRRDAERKARGRSSESNGSPPGVQAESARPDPTRPDPAVPDPSDEEPAPPDVADSAAGQLLEILNRQERFRPVSAAVYEVGIKSAVDAYPGKDPFSAAHEAVAIASDPAWRMTNPLRVFTYCLRRQEAGTTQAESSGQNVVQLNRTCRRCGMREVDEGYGAFCEPCSEAIAG